MRGTHCQSCGCCTGAVAVSTTVAKEATWREAIAFAKPTAVSSSTWITVACIRACAFAANGTGVAIRVNVTIACVAFNVGGILNAEWATESNSAWILEARVFIHANG